MERLKGSSNPCTTFEEFRPTEGRKRHEGREQDKNQEQPFVVVRESAAEVKFQRERVVLQDELDHYAKSLSSSNPDVFQIVDKKNKLVE